MDALQTDAVQTYALHRPSEKLALVILNTEGSCLEYTPNTEKLEVVLQSRGLLLTGLTKVTICSWNPVINRYQHPTFSGDRLHTFFHSEQWRDLITGCESLQWAAIRGTPTTLYDDLALRNGQSSFSVSVNAHTWPYKWFTFDFSIELEEQELSYDRAILREQEYIHEYTNAAHWSTPKPYENVNDVRIAYHQANLAAMQERRLAVMMSLHPRLGESSGLRHFEKEFLKGICDGDIEAA
jgi:hypothetical protein